MAKEYKYIDLFFTLSPDNLSYNLPQNDCVYVGYKKGENYFSVGPELFSLQNTKEVNFKFAFPHSDNGRADIVFNGETINFNLAYEQPVTYYFRQRIEVKVCNC